ncbi:hypothetical protein [Pigmentiphaga daeguensis]|uniref:ParB-like N-terminal domain-containing protein n=1 Tax=Pigmentiphaga daeguensis TaxID=414049 RepID=A0ABN1B8V0_9BURK
MQLINLPLDDIRIDGGTQPRTAINEDVVADYAAALTDGEKLPPVVVFFDGVAHWLADGFHRYRAHRGIGMLSIQADVRGGTRRDAILHSVGANASHGLRRTNDDKRKAVRTLLADSEWAAWSDNQLARACRVSPHTVAAVRKEVTMQMHSEESTARTYTTRHGAQAVMNTANIGRRDPPAAGAAEGEPEVPAPAAPPVERKVDTPPPIAPEVSIKPAPAPTSPPNPQQERIGDLEEQIDALRERNSELERENEALRLAADPAALTRIEQLQSQIQALTLARDTQMEKAANLVREVHRLRRRLGESDA